jgi:hypothetical protein
MGGRPVWLASVSQHDTKTGKAVPTGTWAWWELRKAEEKLDWLLAGVGDQRRGEREFRMNVTLCRHLSISDRELRGLTGNSRWEACPVRWSLAGGPIEVIYEKYIQHPSPTTKPCVNPERHVLGKGSDGKDLWVPIDCGECETCRARKLVETTGQPYHEAILTG